MYELQFALLPVNDLAALTHAENASIKIIQISQRLLLLTLLFSFNARETKYPYKVSKLHSLTVAQ